MNDTPAQPQKQQSGKPKGAQGSGARRLVKHSSIYAAGNILRQLVGFIMLPVYTRYLTPADYGVVGLLIFMVSLIELVFGARMAQALPKFYFERKDSPERHAVISTALLITSAISLLALLLVLLLREPTSQGLFGSGDYGLLVGLFSVLILTHALENYALIYIRIRQKPWLFIGVNMAKLVVQLGLNIWLVVFEEMGVMGVAISNITASILFAILLTGYTIRFTGLRIDMDLGRRMLIFCWPLWLAGLAGLYIQSANRYYIRIFSSLDDVGLYELAAKFGTIITLLVWKPFAQYWQTERFNFYHKGNAEPVFQAVFRFISTLLVIAALGVGLFADPLIRVMAAPAFHEAAGAVPFLVFGALFGSLVTFSNFGFLVKEKTGWISRNNYATAVIVTVLYLALIPLLGFVGAAAALMLAQGLQFLIVHQVARRHYDMGIPLSPLFISLTVAAAGMLAATWLRQPNLVIDILVKAGIFGLCGLALMALLWRDPAARQRLLDLMPARLRQRISPTSTP